MLDEIIEYSGEFYAEMKPDVYGGPNYDEHIPKWDVWAEGDKDGPGPMDAELVLYAGIWPPGTKVTVEVPCCPKCGLPASINALELIMNEFCECGFNWKEWATNKYS